MKPYNNIIKMLLILLFCGIYIVSVALGQERILSFHNCKYDEDCIVNSFCYRTSMDNGKCKCRENYTLITYNTVYECLAVATGIGSPCAEDIQCELKLGTLASCDENENVCKCISVAHLGKDDMCHKTVALGETCETNNNCLLDDGSYGFCVVGKCVCNTNHHISQDGKSCILSSYLQQACIESESCKPTFSNCYGGICKCIPGYIESDDNTECLQAASAVGDNCTQSIQCSEYVKGSFCYNNTCTCKSAHHGYGNECVVDSKLGEKCNFDKECILNAELEHSVRCTDGLCACVQGVSDKNSYGCIIRNVADARTRPLSISILLVSIFLALT